MVDKYLEQISDIGHISSHILMPHFAYFATNTLEQGPCEIVIYLLYNFHKSLRVTLLRVVPLS